MEDKEFIELLSDYEHDRWSRQMNTDYNNLSNEEKESDRKEAIKILNIIKENRHE